MVILLLFFFLLQDVQYRPKLVEKAPVECMSAEDKFLCEALIKGRELIEQQVNCEVNQSYVQKDWNGNLLTSKPDYYYVRVEKGEEVYRKIKSNGKIGSAQRRPDYQARPVYATAGWYEKPVAILTKSSFHKIEETDELVTYNYVADKALPLEHSDLWTVTVMSRISGQIVFERKSKLLRRVQIHFDITPKEQSKHKFRLVEEEIVFGNPKGFEEVMPVPVKFWSKLDFSGTRIIIEANYNNYRRFASDIVFKNAEPDWSTLSYMMRFPSGLGSGQTKKASKEEIFRQLRPGLGLLEVYYKEKGKLRKEVCTAYVYQKGHLLTNGHCFPKGYSSATLYVEGKFVSVENTALLGHDVAVIKSDRVSLSKEFLFSSPSVGETFYTLGYPGRKFTESSGKWNNKYSAVLNNGNSTSTEKDVLFADIEVIEGASGSPAFNERLVFVGLLIGKIQQENGDKLFLNGEEIYKLLKQHNLIDR